MFTTFFRGLSMNGIKKAFWILLSIGAVAGVLSIIWRLTVGEKPTSLSSVIPWGIWVAFYTYLIGLSIGSFLYSTLIYVFRIQRLEKTGRIALVVSLFALIGGLLFIWIDLGHPIRFWRILVNWNYTSILAWETLFYLFYIIILLASLWLILRCDLADVAESSTGAKRILYKILSLNFRCPKTENEFKACHSQSMRVARILGIIGIPAAIGAIGMGGALFSVVAAKPFWFSAIVPIVFILSGLASGTAAVLFLYAFFGHKDSNHVETVRTVANLLILFIVLIPILLFFELLVGLYTGIPERKEVFLTILFGPFWYTFWIGQLLLGTLIPILIVAFKNKNPNWLGIAGLSALIGFVNVRLNFVIPAFITPPIKGLDKAYFDKRWTYFYFPSTFEWITTVFIVALTIFLIALAFKVLPMYERVELRLKGGS